MPYCKKDLNAKFICDLEEYGCRGFWGNNKISFQTHCSEAVSHQKALDKKNGVKKLEKEKLFGIPDNDTMKLLSTIPDEVVTLMTTNEKTEYFNTLKVLYIKKMAPYVQV